MNKYLTSIALIMAMLVVFSYVGFFYFKLNYGISESPEVWGQLGDYIGGLLNPILSFFSIVLLIKSLRLQNEANRGLVDQISDSRKTEKIRSFESQLFNMIESQKSAFESLRIKIKNNRRHENKYSIEAVHAIEQRIASLRQQSTVDQDITDALEDLDSHDQIFSAARRFYIMVRMISEKLSELEGFSERDRKSHFRTLINFTDFTLLRLILISIQFMDYPSTAYLKSNREFNEVLEELGLSCDLY